MQLRINRDGIRTIEEAEQKALKEASDDIVKDVKASDYVPVRTGELKRSIKAEVGNNSVVLTADTDYASGVYYDPSNPKSHWFEPWISGERKDYMSERFAMHLKENIK